MSEIGSGSGSSFPSALDTDNTVEVNSPNAGKTKARAEVPNDLAACVVAIETELGTDPAGILTDVKTYLQTEHQTDGTHGAITPTSVIMQSGQISWTKGSDLASATALPITTGGNYFDVTGNTTIGSFASTGTVGTVIKLHFDGALILEYDAADLILPDGLDITTVAGDEFEFIEYASGASRQVTNSAGTVLQMVNAIDGAVATGTTVMPYDDTIPQNTEGDEYITLPVTPIGSTNKLRIDVVVNLDWNNTAGRMSVALFQDTTAGALAATNQFPIASGNGQSPVTFTHWMTSGTTSATTFKIRAGSVSAGTTTFNGASSGRKFGGVCASTITITEIKV